MRIEPGVRGRFLEVYDADTDTGFEAGRVTTWEPGERLAPTWTQVGWPEGVTTDIDRNAAQEFVDGDPFVLNGVIRSWQIREWNEVLAA